MALFKRAAVRGIAHELVRTGVCSFPSKLAMDGAADAVADAPQGPAAAMPEMSPPEGHDPEQVAAVANKLIEIAHELMQHASGGGEGAAPGLPPGAPPPEAEALSKESAASDYDTLAYNAAVECMDKAAAEVKQASGLMHGGDAQNTPAAAVSAGSEVAKLDAKQRPDGKYHDGRAKTQLDTQPGAIGDLSKNPVQPSNTVSGTNSVNKNAAYEAIIAKYAGALMKGGDKQNTPAAAAAAGNEVAKLDNAQRPQGKYLVGQGKANFTTPAGAHIGIEEKQPVQPSNTVSGSNSIIAASKAASDLSTDEQAYLELFQKTAADVGPHLPKTLSEEEKVAALQRMIPMSHEGRQAELDALYKAASMPPALAAALEDKGESKSEKKDDDKKDEKKDDDDKKAPPFESKKESSLLTAIRNVAAKHAAGAR